MTTDTITPEELRRWATIKTSSAIFSACRTYRYALARHWIGGDGYAMFIGLNPSTADETNDDPTIRRCIGYAKSWGYSGIYMVNIFAFRATDPKVMLAAADPIGPDNDRTILELAADAGVIVAAWGAFGDFMGRGAAVRSMLGDRLHYLRLTKFGNPGHPLYLPKNLWPQRWV